LRLTLNNFIIYNDQPQEIGARGTLENDRYNFCNPEKKIAKMH